MEDRKIFNKIIPLILRNEGGYVNNPADRGGATNKGITQGTYNSYLKGKGLEFKDVRFITQEEVFDIYYNKYWIPSKAYLMPPKLATVHFDASVNWGLTGGAKMLQMLLGVNVDGSIGPKTLAAIESFPELDLALKYCDLRVERRYKIVEKNPSQKVFLKGWLNRDARVRNFIEKEI